ncbi:MAG: hypothetical protein ACM3S2_21745 [Ignavibacteriales bacterium]
MVYEVLILDNFTWQGFKGKLYFTRYNDLNPALVYKASDETPIITCTDNIPDFYREYPFGENRLVVIRKEYKGIAEALHEAGIIAEPVFTISGDGGDDSVCELTDQVVDLLKAYGEYYV